MGRGVYGVKRNDYDDDDGGGGDYNNHHNHNLRFEKLRTNRPRGLVDQSDYRFP
jgi:hypothetical protein